jgi:hypothetical protein
MAAAGIFACGKALKVKIYYSRPDLGGIYREQDKEVVKYEATEGFRCVSPADWEAILHYMKACKGAE